MAAFSFDEALVRRVAQGERDALARLYDANKGAAYALALFICGSPRLAEEAVCRAFLELWERKASLCAAGGDGAAVRFRTALRRHCRSLRARGEAGGASVAAHVISNSELGKLPEDEREALLLVFWRGYDEAEASGLTGRAPEVVRKLVRRGLERLAELMPEEGGAR